MMRLRLTVFTLAAVIQFTSGLPCPNLCNQHGYCDLKERECRCFGGYEGADCSRRKCPTSNAWADIAAKTDDAHNEALCSNMGLCDFISGTCSCFAGFTGKACERSVCPNHCNYNGKCMSMQRIAREYGLDYANWDATKMWGCHCDEGWEGFDCSLRTCPTGDDPLTIDQNLEKQLIVLFLANGNKPTDPEAINHAHTFFTLSYKGQVTVPIFCDDTALDLKRKLEALTSIATVDVDFLDEGNTYMCGTEIDGVKEYQFVSVTFLRDFGDLPPLQVRTRAGNLGRWQQPSTTAGAQPPAGVVFDATMRFPSEQYNMVRTACKTNDLYPYPRVAGPYPGYSRKEVGIYARAGNNPGLGCDLETAVHLTHPRIKDTSVLIPVVGTKEEQTCSGRGICNHKNGICECSYNFESSDGGGENAVPGTRGECGYKVGPVVSCPGEMVSCSGHGVCSNDPEYVCSCDVGWQGADCSLRTCPSGKAWFDVPSTTNVAHYLAECSNKGICDRETGICKCIDGFTGAACERLRCNMVLAEDLTLGGEWLEPGVECNGHGQCLPMQDLAHYRFENGVPTDISYGMTPNNPQTWDYDVVHGCLCDEGWEGADCSMRSCPTGDNPDSPGQNEIQRFSCYRVLDKTTEFFNEKTGNYEYDKDAGFTLNFRTCATQTILWSATMEDIEDALEATACLKDVKVKWEYRDDLKQSLTPKDKQIACGDGILQRAWWSVEFVTEVGDLPQMTIVETKKDLILDPHIIFEEQTAQDCTRENEICSVRGVCDYTKGQCACFAGWGSSNGQGDQGTLEDCGWRIPIYGQHYLSKYEMNDEDRLQKQVQQMAIKLWDKYNYKS